MIRFNIKLYDFNMIEGQADFYMHHEFKFTVEDYEELVYVIVKKFWYSSYSKRAHKIKKLTQDELDNTCPFDIFKVNGKWNAIVFEMAGDRYYELVVIEEE